MTLVFMHFLFGIVNVVVSYVFKKQYPKEINTYFGYRTKRSMASPERWIMANRYSSGLLFKSSLATIVFQCVACSIFALDTAIILTIIFWIAAILFTSLKTEQLLKKSFS